jgi:hypothetical protein
MKRAPKSSTISLSGGASRRRRSPGRRGSRRGFAQGIALGSRQLRFLNLLLDFHRLTLLAQALLKSADVLRLLLVTLGLELGVDR